VLDKAAAWGRVRARVAAAAGARVKAGVVAAAGAQVKVKGAALAAAINPALDRAAIVFALIVDTKSRTWPVSAALT
jgi:hypothetical protein